MLYKLKLKNSDKYVLLDDHVYEFLSSHPLLKEMNFLTNLRRHSTSGAAVFQRWWHRTEDGKQRIETIYLHKFIAEEFIERTSEAHKYAWHVNGNHLDCRLKNLRWCTRSEMNMLSKFKSDSQYKGVSKEGNRYRAKIYVDNKPVHLGMFATPEEAAEAYNEKAKEVFGEGTRLNRIKSHEVTIETSEPED
jgi:hypothetical protein